MILEMMTMPVSSNDYGAPDSVHLVMAAECFLCCLIHFQSLRIEVRYFSYTFANNERQIIPYEAPTAVNTAFSHKTTC